MTFFSVVLAVLLDQFRFQDKALPERWLTKFLLIGTRQAEEFGFIVWWLWVPGAAAVSYLIYTVLQGWSGLLAWLWNVGVLFLCIGWRKQLRAFSDVHLAISMGDQEEARRRLSFWRGADCSAAGTGEVVRLAIEQLLLGSHRRMFGVLFWFVLLPGPCGAVLYALAWRAAQVWSERDSHLSSVSRLAARYAHRAFDALDALPVRLTALFYSIFGNFEEALYCWRAQSVLWPHKLSGILLASGAGALGIRLGLPIHTPDGVQERPAMGAMANEHRADTVSMQAAAQLVWRVLLLWLLLLVLFGAAGLFSR